MTDSKKKKSAKKQAVKDKAEKAAEPTPAEDEAAATPPEKAASTTPPETAEKAAATAENAPPPTDDLAAAQQALEAARQEAQTNYENYLRAAAEVENIRRRSEKKISEAYQYALAGFALAVGDVRDCLEAALNDDGDKIREGLSLTLRKLVTAMDSNHILPIRPDIGASFDPALHMAIGMTAATAEAPANTVANVVQAGYLLNGRVLRAAGVIVSQAAETDAPGGQPETTTPDGENN